MKCNFLFFFLFQSIDGFIDAAENYLEENPEKVCTLTGDKKFLEGLGHTKDTPTCFLMVFFMSGSNKRGVTSCIPASYFTRVYPYARGIEEAVKGVEEETETAMETSWANVALNIFHCVMAALNLWAYRRRPQGHVVAQDNGRQLARRAREEEEE